MYIIICCIKKVLKSYVKNGMIWGNNKSDVVK